MNTEPIGKPLPGRGPAPNPDARRRLTHPNSGTFGCVTLPAEGRDGPIPDLPDPAPWLVKLGGWPVSTRVAWAKLWRTSAATHGKNAERRLHGWASLHAWMEINGPTSAGFGELRHVAESHGLFPRALLSLRWIVAAAPVESTLAMSARSNSSGTDRRTRFLRAVAKVDGS